MFAMAGDLKLRELRNYQTTRLSKVFEMRCNCIYSFIDSSRSQHGVISESSRSHLGTTLKPSCCHLGATLEPSWSHLRLARPWGSGAGMCPKGSLQPPILWLQVRCGEMTPRASVPQNPCATGGHTLSPLIIVGPLQHCKSGQTPTQPRCLLLRSCGAQPVCHRRSPPSRRTHPSNSRGMDRVEPPLEMLIHLSIAILAQVCLLETFHVIQHTAIQIAEETQKPRRRKTGKT